jgi:glycosyltransferase involved in cell wall biosynthesis
MQQSKISPKISVVLGTYNRYRFLKLALQSIREELKRLSCVSEIIVIDGGSTDKTLKWLTKQKDIVTIIQHNRDRVETKRRSWGYFMNLGFKCAQGKYVCMLSDDCLVVPNAIVNGYELFEKKLAPSPPKKVGALAFYWREWPKDKTYHVGLTERNNVFVNHGMYLRSVLEEVGYIDENRYSFYCADADLCLKMLEIGYETLPSPNSYIEHYPHANQKIRNSNLKKLEGDKKAFAQRWSNNKSIPENKNLCIDRKAFFDSTKTGCLFKKIDRTSPSIWLFKTRRFIAKTYREKIR